MNPSYNPEGWLDLVPYFLVAIPATIAAYVSLKGTRAQKVRHRENKEKIEELKYEIKITNDHTNDHSTNLRYDIDAIAELVREGFRETHREIGGLREELRTERIERIEGDRLREAK